MKTFKDRKGFTLIELLAVIVVLAIVMVLATTTVLPLMSTARRNSFVLEANAARETASQVMSLIAINSTSDLQLPKDNNADYQVNADKTTYCFSLKQLAKTGLWKKDLRYLEAKEGTPEYEGKVIVTTDSENPNKYNYQVIMHNASLYVNATRTVVEGDVGNYKTQKGFGCNETISESGS